MKITLAAVSSINGKITRGEELTIYSWTSPEDQKLFFSQIKKHNLVVMGANTYESNRKIIKLEENKLRIVITRSPIKYKNQEKKGLLEFTSENPANLVQRLSSLGYKQMLLAGGGEINSFFLKEGLVDEIYLTIEPKIFGLGKSLFTEDNLNVNLMLKSVKRLNKSGTIQLIYAVQK